MFLHMEGSIKIARLFNFTFYNLCETSEETAVLSRKHILAIDLLGKCFGGDDDMRAAMSTKFYLKNCTEFLEPLDHGAGHFKTSFPARFVIYLNDNVANPIALAAIFGNSTVQRWPVIAFAPKQRVK